MQLDTLFQCLWRDYVAITPQAQRIHDLFTERGERIVNDHVALRSFDLSPISLRELGRHITSFGYSRDRCYRFADKKLRAQSFLHPDPARPRIFLSALQVHAVSPAARKLIEHLVGQVDAGLAERPEILCAGRAWAMPGATDYRALLAESEYAAWLAVHGLRANHFTISVNHLTRTPDLREVVDLIKSEGHAVNSAGGEIKGQPKACSNRPPPWPIRPWSASPTALMPRCPPATTNSPNAIGTATENCSRASYRPAPTDCSNRRTPAPPERCIDPASGPRTQSATVPSHSSGGIDTRTGP